MNNDKEVLLGMIRREKERVMREKEDEYNLLKKYLPYFHVGVTLACIGFALLAMNMIYILAADGQSVGFMSFCMIGFFVCLIASLPFLLACRKQLGLDNFRDYRELKERMETLEWSKNDETSAEDEARNRIVQKSQKFYKICYVHGIITDSQIDRPEYSSEFQRIARQQGLDEMTARLMFDIGA